MPSSKSPQLVKGKYQASTKWDMNLSVCMCVSVYQYTCLVLLTSLLACFSTWLPGCLPEYLAVWQANYSYVCVCVVTVWY